MNFITISFHFNSSNILLITYVFKTNIDTKDFVDWFQQTADTKGKLQASHPNTAVEKHMNNCR